MYLFVMPLEGMALVVLATYMVVDVRALLPLVGEPLVEADFELHRTSETEDCVELGNVAADSLTLPAIALALPQASILARVMRSSLLEVLGHDYMRTARAKGVGETDVLFRHAFRNSLLPLITVAAHILPSLLAGSVVVETIFSIDGMGRLIVQAVKIKDQEVVMAGTLVGGLLGLASYLIADLGYVIADPRVSYE